MFSLRRQVTPEMQQTPIPSAEAVTSKLSLQERVGGLVKAISSILPGQKEQVSPTPAVNEPISTPSTTEASPATIGKTLADAIDEVNEENEEKDTQNTVSDAAVNIVENTESGATAETITEATPPEPPAAEVVEAASENSEAEEKTIPPVEEIAPEAELAPPAEAPPEKIPPTDLPPA